jgi:hypothetical protein
VPAAKNVASLDPDARRAGAKTPAESGAKASSGRHALDPMPAQDAASAIPETENAASNNGPDAIASRARAVPSDRAVRSLVTDPQNAASDTSPQPASALPPDGTVEPSPGRLLRGAKVYSGPSTSSSLIGYAAPGSEIQLLERKSAWARVVDPATSRQGWVNSEDITLTDTLSLAATTPRGANASDAGAANQALEDPRPSVKGKKSRKKHAKKRWRKSLRYVFRF